MADYAMRSDLDALRQQLLSDPAENGRPLFRGITQTLARDYAAVAYYAETTWRNVFTFSGRGGLLYPDRHLEIKAIVSINNFEADSRNFAMRLRLGDRVLWQNIALTLAPNDHGFYEVLFRLMGQGDNESLGLWADAGFESTPPIYAPMAGFDLAASIDLAIDVRWTVAHHQFLAQFALYNYVVTLT